jgi:ribosomal protein S25
MNILVIDQETQFRILNKFFQKKYCILIFIYDNTTKGKSVTVLDIVKAFQITEKYAYKILKILNKDKLIIKGTRLNGFSVYKLTPKAKIELSMVSEILKNIENYSNEITQPIESSPDNLSVNTLHEEIK